MDTESRLRSRRAIEALRNGVPSRDAVLSLGCDQPVVERRFRDLMGRAKAEGREGRGVRGFLLRGDFGTGKSHVLEYLRQMKWPFRKGLFAARSSRARKRLFTTP